MIKEAARRGRIRLHVSLIRLLETDVINDKNNYGRPHRYLDL